jgi:hypothetical protein
MSASRLISEFKAQDVGAWLSVFDGVSHTRVAKWNESNQGWDVLPEGHALLTPVVAEEVAVEKPVVRRNVKIKGLSEILAEE